MEIRGIYRSGSHLPIWHVLQEAGIWQSVGVELTEFTYCGSSAEAESLLFSGAVDFISGNHITPYAMVARGLPIVCLASPCNVVADTLVTRTEVSDLGNIHGLRLGETPLIGPDGGYAHIRGNHLLYLERAGLAENDVQWVELAESMSDGFAEKALRSMANGEIDAVIASSGLSAYRELGCHLLPLAPLPMITGPTITTATATLKRRPELGAKLVRAMSLGIRMVKTEPQKVESILADWARRENRPAIPITRFERFDAKPYPGLEALANAYSLCLRRYPESAQVSPLALWDLHDLRQLDDEGFFRTP